MSTIRSSSRNAFSNDVTLDPQATAERNNVELDPRSITNTTENRPRFQMIRAASGALFGFGRRAWNQLVRPFWSNRRVYADDSADSISQRTLTTYSTTGRDHFYYSSRLRGDAELTANTIERSIAALDVLFPESSRDYEDRALIEEARASAKNITDRLSELDNSLAPGSAETYQQRREAQEAAITNLGHAQGRGDCALANLRELHRPYPAAAAIAETPWADAEIISDHK